MKLKKFLRENKKGFLYSSLAVILLHPLIYLVQNGKGMPISNFIISIPICLSMMFIFMMLFGLFLGEGEEDGN